MSNNVPNTLTKSTGSGLSAMLYGNWADLIIGEWRGLDILADPYSQRDRHGAHYGDSHR